MKKQSFQRISTFFFIPFITVICGGFVIHQSNPVSTSALVAHTTTTSAPSTEELYTRYVTDIYQTAQLEKANLDFHVFRKAITGFLTIKNESKFATNKSILTIADFNQSSKQKRLWIIDLDKKTLLLNTWVAHGKQSGDDMATHFSNTTSSNQSSLGFYITGETYLGNHGRSLRLDGIDAGFNTNARQRAVVVHGADYVSQSVINQLGRLGRSFGCPAVASELSDLVIDMIQNRTVLFINGPDSKYTSKYLDEKLAMALVPPVQETTDQSQLQAKL